QGCTAIFPNPQVDCLNDDVQGYVAGCRKTCSRCCEDPKFSSCKDESPDCEYLFNPFSDCTRMPDLSFQMCKSYCGLCEEKTPLCTDKATDCTRLESLCTTDSEVAEKCSKTCKLCGVPTTTTTTTKKTTTTTKKVVTTTKKACFDADEACPSWVKNGFCSNPDASLKQKYCAKSCGYC
ncbi:hypothetical protein PMAYCL1PPCAC_17996, partial [Pristionchus mayeri]